MVVDLVNGKSVVLGVIGNPISHTFSPQIHNTIASFLQMNTIYVPFHVKEENLQYAIHGARALSVSGLNVTVPHKKEVMQYLCKVDTLAEKTMAVNTLKLTEDGYIGYNTDVLGILGTFKINNFLPSGLHALVIGAGGSANAVCVALAESGIKRITIANRTLDAAKTLTNTINSYYNIEVSAVTLDEMQMLRDVDVIIQTTVLGFGKYAGDSPVSNELLFQNASFVFDVIYTPWETSFLKIAKKYCALCTNGFDMLFYQAISAFEIFTDIKIVHTNMNVHGLKEKLKDYYRNANNAI